MKHWIGLIKKWKEKKIGKKLISMRKISQEYFYQTTQACNPKKNIKNEKKKRNLIF